ncbi:MAG TPA: A/G-specific adenine glycosylase [Chitinophagaceae bacterium]|nr:A/G-specific adenine glycosylase [Chitinophagaceae bacterium]
MPWKGEADPYRIWLSEIILQQTRVEQGWAYYERFIQHFPTVHHLAKASLPAVYKLWEGLGYYTRCKNLHETARIISTEHNGVFPASHEAIRQLKGIGPYTAAAIASFAFKLPYAVVDGNVQRILSRYFGINTPVDTGEGKKLYAELAQSLLDTADPGKYNQAIMDFGATICKPQKPLCQVCVQRKDCQAFAHGWVNELPVKEKILVKKTRWFNYFIMELNGEVLIRQRNGKDIWTNLFEFVLHESEHALLSAYADMHHYLRRSIGHEGFCLKQISKPYKQQLTHQTIVGQFITVELEKPPSQWAGLLVPKKLISTYAFPKMINLYMQNESGMR